MHPIIANIGPIYVYSYGLMIAIGFAIGIILAYKHANEFGINKEDIVDFGIVVLGGGLFGARIFYVLLNLKYYRLHPLEIPNITKGGFVWYGAFIAGIITAILFTKKKKINFWAGGDLFMPYIALGQAMGRIGCFLNGCCYGAAVPSNCIISVVFPGETVFRHPTQIYSCLSLLLLFVVLRKWQEKRRFPGEIFLGYVLCYSVIRFGMEFLRGDNAKILSGLTTAQLISILLFGIALILFLYRFFKWRKKYSVSA